MHYGLCLFTEVRTVSPLNRRCSKAIGYSRTDEPRVSGGQREWCANGGGNMSLLSKIQVRLHLLLAFLLIASFQVAWAAPAKATVAGAPLSGLGTDDHG